MNFNSLEFAVFVPIAFFIYWFITNKSIRSQNLFIVVASYTFYGWWNWRFLSLILFSTLVDYTIGLSLVKEKNSLKRKILLWTSIGFNLSLLAFFKYYNFFLDSFISAFSIFGKEISANSLEIILPVGISFYTFQTLSYTIDVYKRKLEPTKDIIAFSAFVSFFPQLVAGPIERATNLLPQFSQARKFNYAKTVDGLRQILWGLFKKIVIADNCAEYANLIFNNSADYSGVTLVLGAMFFALQIYGDFSGYSDIAIGTSKLFGFQLMQNFAFPYFARDIAEFWRRWHISLSSWFKDYLYIPLGGSRGGTWMKVRNTFIIFIVSGFWHGANWTFIVWGALNAVYFLPLLLSKNNRRNLDSVAQGRLLPSIKELSAIFITFSMTTFSWIFFRAENIEHALEIISDIFKSSSSLALLGSSWELQKLISLIVFFTVIEWFGKEEKYAIEKIGLKWKRPLRYMMYYMIMLFIYWFGGNEEQFIYFQF